jgi:hypothetical protein
MIKEVSLEVAGTNISSWYVFHSFQEGQRPIHFADSTPQFWQIYTVLLFAMIVSSISNKYIERSGDFFFMVLPEYH